jgi:sugar lactone lactonase YvrE
VKQSLITVLVFVGILGLFAQTVAAQQSVTFPQVTAVGVTAPVLSVPVTLAKGGTIGSVQVLTQGSAGFDFTSPGGGTCVAGSSLLAGQQCTVAVGFQPIAPGRRLGAVVLLGGNGAPLATVFLQASATGSVSTFVPGAINTVAGDSAWIYAGDGGPATDSAIFLPFGFAVNTRGDIFLADSSNDRIRKVDALTGLISTIAGNGLIGATGDGGSALLATISNPSSIALDPAGNIFFADSGNNAIRRIDAFTGIITTVAGTIAQHGYTGDSGLATLATLNGPNGIAIDGSGNLYIADTGNNVVRLVSGATGIISTIAGTGAAGYGGDGGPATSAQLNSPWGVTPSVTGQLYIADQNNNRIRAIGTSGVITTVVGTGTEGFSGDAGPASAATLNVPASVAIDAAGNLYVADSGNNRVRKINASTGIITTIAGGTSQAFSGDSGPANQAGLYGPYTLALDSQGSLFIADVFHNRIRKVSANAATLVYQPIRVDRVSTALTQVLENDGNAPLNLASITAITAAQVDPTTTTCTASSTLAPLSTCVIGLDFAPTTLGLLVFGSADAVSNAGNSPGVITLEGQVLSVDPATVTIASSANPGTTGTPILFTVTVSSQGTTPTGVVTLLDGTSTLAAQPLQNGIATFNISTLTGGQHSLTASYPGDSSNAAAVSSPLTVLTAGVNPSTAGAALQLSAAVNVVTQGSGVGTIAGTVVFLDGSTTIGSGVIVNGMATLSVKSLAVGSHTLTATYSGNVNYAASSSNAIVERIQIATTSAVLSSSANPAIAGAPLTLSAALVTNGGVPTGTVAFADGTTSLGTATVNAQGVATLVVPGASWTVGTHTLVATYGGDAFDTSAVSSPLKETVNIATTTVALTTSLTPAGLGSQIVFKAAVSGNGGQPTGSVQFFDGTTSLGSANLASGSASLSVGTLTLGTHTITAVYSGDTLDGSATSTPLSEVIQQATIAISLTSSASPANFGTPVTFSASVTGTGSQPVGTVIFVDTNAGQTTTLATVPVSSSGLATVTNSALSIGTHSITAQYSGDVNHAAATSTALAERIVQTTSTTLNSSAPHSIAGTPVTWTAAVTGANNQPITGTITISDGATVVTAATPNTAGTISFTSAAMIPGTHTLVAAYSGDTLNAASSSTPAVQTVAIAQTSTAFTTSVNPAFAGSTLTLAATITGNGGTPGGSVTFLDGATVLSTVPLNGAGSASLALTSLLPGIHQLSATYSGDTNDQPSVSATIAQQIVERTSVALASSANPSLLTDNVTITVTVANGVPTVPPTGIVTLTDSGTTISSSQINAAGTATFTLNAPTLGQHTLVASYSGDDNNTAATSQALVQAVTLRPTTTGLTASSTALSNGQQEIFFSIVAPSGTPGSRPPTGQITFQSGSTVLGSATISSSGVATLTINPPQGTLNAVAQYSGDSLYASSASPATVIVVGPPIEFTLSTQSAVQVQSGQHTSMQITIASAPTFSDSIALGCAGLPASATCTFSSDNVAVTGGKGQTVTLTVDTGNPLGAGASVSLNRPQRGHTSRLPLACFLPAGAFLFLLARRRREFTRHITLFTALLVLVLTSLLSGCGSSLNVVDTPAGAYNFQIVGTGATTGATGTATVQFTVTK